MPGMINKWCSRPLSKIHCLVYLILRQLCELALLAQLVNTLKHRSQSNLISKYHYNDLRVLFLEIGSRRILKREIRYLLALTGIDTAGELLNTDLQAISAVDCLTQKIWSQGKLQIEFLVSSILFGTINYWEADLTIIAFTQVHIATWVQKVLSETLS